MVDVHPLSDAVTVLVDETRYLVKREELIPLEEFEALKAKAEAGCSKHENGGCTCGARSGEATAETEVDEDDDGDLDLGYDVDSGLDATPPRLPITAPRMTLDRRGPRPTPATGGTRAVAAGARGTPGGGIRATDSLCSSTV